MTVIDYAETASVWADAYGGWHVRIAFQFPYTRGEMLAYRKRHRARASRMIRREILAREAGPIAPIRLADPVLDLNPEDPREVVAITFREAGPGHDLATVRPVCIV